MYNSENEHKKNIIVKFHEESGLELELCAHLVEMFLTNGMQVIESIENAIDNREKEDGLRLVHGLKGNAGNLRAEEVAKIALKIEIAIRNETFDEAIKGIVLLKEQMSFLE